MCVSDGHITRGEVAAPTVRLHSVLSHTRSAGYYLKVMKKIMDAGVEFVSKETERLERMISGSSFVALQRVPHWYPPSIACAHMHIHTHLQVEGLSVVTRVMSLQKERMSLANSSCSIGRQRNQTVVLLMMSLST